MTPLIASRWTVQKMSPVPAARTAPRPPPTGMIERRWRNVPRTVLMSTLRSESYSRGGR